ncbi:MAG TPA: DNRLRE domain-containing protein [bacterium]|nr:DNRLRE domain-containing protein [bacterium]
MRKTVVMLGVILLIGACGPKGDPGAAGPSGAGSFAVINFEHAVFPSTSYTGVYDTCITPDSPAGNYGDCTSFIVGAGYRGLLWFDLDGYVTGNITVKRADLTLYCYSKTAGDTIVAAYKMLASWTEGNDCIDTSTAGVTWNTRNGTTSWTAGGPHDTAASSEAKTVAETGYFTIQLNPALVQGWIDAPDSNYGILLKSSNESPVSSYINMYTNEAGTPCNKPRLTLHYTIE